MSQDAIFFPQRLFLFRSRTHEFCRRALKKIGETAETGYSVAKKVEQPSVDALLEKKLIKKGAKDKVSYLIKYYIFGAGKKHTS